VWAGANCTFNNMTQRVSDIAKDPSTKEYKFGVQGMLAQLPTRITSTLHTTVSITQGRTVILRSNQDNGSAASTSFNQVFRGFENSTWMTIGIILLILLSLAILITFSFNGTVAPIEVILTITSEPAIPDEDEVATKNHQRRRCTIALNNATRGRVFRPNVQLSCFTRSVL